MLILTKLYPVLLNEIGPGLPVSAAKKLHASTMEALMKAARSVAVGESLDTTWKQSKVVLVLLVACPSTAPSWPSMELKHKANKIYSFIMDIVSI
jgi:hypothetical protein